MSSHTQFANYLNRRSRRDVFVLFLLTDVPYLVAFAILPLIARYYFTLERLEQSDWGHGLCIAGAPMEIVQQCVQEVHDLLHWGWLISCIGAAIFLFLLFRVVFDSFNRRLSNFVILKLIINESLASAYQGIRERSRPYEILVTFVILAIIVAGLVFSLLRIDTTSSITVVIARIVIPGILILAITYVLIDRKVGLMHLLLVKPPSPENFHRLLLARSIPILFLCISFYASLLLAGTFLQTGGIPVIRRTRIGVVASEDSLLSKVSESSVSVRDALQRHFEKYSMGIALGKLEKNTRILGQFAKDMSWIVLLVILGMGLTTVLLPVASTEVVKPGIFLTALFASTVITTWFLESVLPPVFSLPRGSPLSLFAVISASFVVAFFAQYVAKYLLMRGQLCPRCFRTRNPGDRYCNHCGLNLKMALGQQAVFVGSLRTKQVHTNRCKFANRIKTDNRVIFNSLQEAYNKGFDNCAYCLGASGYKESV